MAAALRAAIAVALLGSAAVGVRIARDAARVEGAPPLQHTAPAPRQGEQAGSAAEAGAAPDPLRQGWTVDGDRVAVPVAAVALLAVILLVLFVSSKVTWGMAAEPPCLFSDAQVTRMFHRIDTDGSGTLSTEEVRLYMKQEGQAVPDNQLVALMEQADVDKSGDLDLEEFRILLTNIRDENPRDLLRCLTAELIGMLIFQFLGGMPDTGPVGNWLLVVGLIYCFASISGAHFNPAITLAVYMSGQVPLRKALWYVVVNVLAAVDAVLFLRWTGIRQIQSDSGLPIVPCTAPPLSMPISVLFLLEAVCTFTFVIVFLGVALDTKSAWGNIAPVVIGITGYGVSSACGKVSGVSMNPGRFLGPCIGYGCFPGPGRTAAYLCSAFAGSLLATVVYNRVFMNRPPPDFASGMANFQFMVRDCSVMKKQLRHHRRTTVMKPQG